MIREKRKRRQWKRGEKEFDRRIEEDENGESKVAQGSREVESQCRRN